MSDSKKVKVLSPEVSGQLVRMVLGLPEPGVHVDVGVAVRAGLHVDGFQVAGGARFEEIMVARERERARAEKREREEKRGPSISG